MAYPSNSSGHLRAFVERILRMKADAREINDDIREIYAEAKADGYDKTILGQLVSYVEKRAKDPTAHAERGAIFELYLGVYDETGTSLATHAHEDDDVTPEAVAKVRAKAAPALAAANLEEFTEPTEPAPQVTEDAGTDASSSSLVPATTSTADNGTGGASAVVTPAADMSVTSGEAVTAALPAPSPDTRTPVQRVFDKVEAKLTHNPETHFLNSQGLKRLHGCQKPEQCGSDQPRVRRCHGCQLLYAEANGETA